MKFKFPILKNYIYKFLPDVNSNNLLHSMQPQPSSYEAR